MAKPEAADYILSVDPIYRDGQIARYATQDPTVYIEVFTPPTAKPGDPDPDFNNYLEIYDNLRSKLLERDFEAYTPEIIDSDTEDYWVAFGIPEGLYSLEDVAASFPDGIDGRDWAWMIRRILMVLQIGGTRANLVAKNILVHPEEHGVVILGWPPIEDHSVYPLDQLKELMERFLAKSVDAKSQIDLVAKMADAYRANRTGQYQLKIDPTKPLFSYADALREYDLKLRHLYGAPKYRHLVLDDDFSMPFLEDESRLIRE